VPLVGATLGYEIHLGSSTAAEADVCISYNRAHFSDGVDRRSADGVEGLARGLIVYIEAIKGHAGRVRARAGDRSRDSGQRGEVDRRAHGGRVVRTVRGGPATPRT